MIPITDERLQELIKGITLDILGGKDFITDNPSEIYSIFTELQPSRQTIKRLVEDCVRLESLVDRMLGDINSGVDYWSFTIDQHTALLTELATGENTTIDKIGELYKTLFALYRQKWEEGMNMTEGDPVSRTKSIAESHGLDVACQTIASMFGLAEYSK